MGRRDLGERSENGGDKDTVRKADEERRNSSNVKLRKREKERMGEKLVKIRIKQDVRSSRPTYGSMTVEIFKGECKIMREIMARLTKK